MIYFISLICIFREFLIFLRKMLIILIAEVLPIKALPKALLILLILMIYFFVEIDKNPFLTKNLYHFELQGLLMNSFIIFFGMINYIGDYDNFALLFIIIFLIFHVTFYIYWAFQILLKSIFRKLKCQKLTRNILLLLKRFKIFR